MGLVLALLILAMLVLVYDLRREYLDRSRYLGTRRSAIDGSPGSSTGKQSQDCVGGSDVQLLPKALLPTAGAWREITYETGGKITRTALLNCPKCKLMIPLGEIGADGTIGQRIDCPREACSWQDWIKLDGWADE